MQAVWCDVSHRPQVRGVGPIMWHVLHDTSQRSMFDCACRFAVGSKVDLRHYLRVSIAYCTPVQLEAAAILLSACAAKLARA